MTEFDEALQKFIMAMRDKFQKRHDRQHARGFKSVLDPDFTVADFDPTHVWNHFQEEMKERLVARPASEKAREDVDVANMAFLDWWYWASNPSCAHQDWGYDEGGEAICHDCGKVVPMSEVPSRLPPKGVK